jgi:Ca-activated chloride channel homolog
MTSFAAVEWQWPWALLLALVPLVIALVAARRRRVVERYADAPLRPWAISAQAVPTALRWRLGVEALAWLALAIAVAGPRVPTLAVADGAAERDRSGMHLTFVVQVSDSMRVGDLPDPLTRARLAVLDGLPTLRGESLSLIGYGGQTGLLLPATRDLELLRDALAWLDRGVLPATGARLANALELSLAQPLPTNAARHAVVLLTDGDARAFDDGERRRLDAVAAQMAEREVPLFVWFVRSRSAPVTAPAGAGITPYRGDLEAYRQLARRAGGRHAWLEDAGQGWPVLYEQGIARIALPEPDPETLRTYRALYPVPLALAILLFVLSWSRWPRVRLAGHAGFLAVLALGLGLPVPPASARDADEQAWAAYRAGDWTRAMALYQRLGGGPGHAGAGVAALQAGRPVEALSHLELAWMLAADDEVRLDALYNLAHAHAALGRWEAALEAWRVVAASRPDDERVQQNIAVAAEVIQRRMAEHRPAQDLYSRRGSLAEGMADLLGPDVPEPDVVTSEGAGSVAGHAAEADPGQRGTGQPFVLNEQHAASGRIKVERLREQPLQLRQGLVRQDQHLPARVPPSSEAGERP